MFSNTIPSTTENDISYKGHVWKENADSLARIGFVVLNNFSVAPPLVQGNQLKFDFDYDFDHDHELWYNCTVKINTKNIFKKKKRPQF